MSKKTLALIISLVVLTAVLLVIALSTKEQKVANNTPSVPSEQPSPTPPAHSVLTMTPATLDLSTRATGIHTVDVAIDSDDNNVTAVQLEIAYDPKVIRNLQVKPGKFFASPTVLLNKNDVKTGRVSYALGISPAQDPEKGTGTVATLTFTVLPGATGTETQITLLPKSLVTARGVGPSVLKSASGVTIMLPTRSTTSVPSTQVSTAPTTPAH